MSDAMVDATSPQPKRLTSLAHPSDEQLDDLLIGDASADVELHLDGCEACRERLETLSSALHSFNAVSLAWSERKSATLPLPVRAEKIGWRAKAAVAATATALLVAAVFLPVMQHSRAKDAMQQATVSPQPAAETVRAGVSAAQIAQDNQMMFAINHALAAPDPSPLTEYGLSDVSAPARAKSSATLEN